jgi:serine/threonine-protein kinase
MITADGQVRLLDFGIAKLMEGDSTKETQLTQLAGRALTLDYASPEQIKGEPIGTASDVYSLGVVAYELLTGAKPYRLKRGSAAELEEAIATADPPRASEAANEPKNKTALRGDLDAIVAKTLKKMPQERYGTVESLSRDFNAYLSGSAVAARPDSLRYRASKFASRNRRVLLASGAVTIARAVSIGIGATALITLSLAVGLVVSIWQAQIARREKDLALAMSDRNEAASGFIDTLLTQVARSGKPMTATDLIDRAESLLQEEFRQSPDSHGQVLSVLSTSAHTLGQPGRALELIERAIQVTRGTTDHALRNRLELERAIALGWTGRSQEAQTAIEAVLSQGGLRPDESHEGQSYLAHLAYQRGDHPLKQLHHASEALRLLGQVRRPSPKLRASALADLALALFENGKVDEADRMYADVIRLHSTLNGGRSPSALIAMNNWGVMLDSAGDLPAARDIYDRGLSIASEDTPGQPPPLSLFISHARVLHQMGRLDEAEARLRDAIQQAEMQGAILAAKYTRSNLALLCLDRNDLASARRYLQEYDDEARIDLPLQGRYGRARRLADGRLAMAEGRVADAAEALSPLTVDAPRYAITVTALLLRADVWLLQSEPARAEADANRALDIARSLQSRHRPSCRVGLALLTLAKIASYRGDLAQAREKSRLSLAQLEKTLDPSHPARLDAQGRCAATEN